MFKQLPVVSFIFLLIGFAVPFQAEPVQRSYDQSLEEGWNLVSLGIHSDADLAELFGPNFEEARRWDPLSDGYVPVTNLDPGEGCEVNLTAASRITLTGGPVTSPFTMETEKGWNQIGNPFSVEIPWSRVTATRNGVTKKLKKARKAGWVGRARYMDGTRLRKVRYGRDSLPVGEGYWIKVKKDGITLTFESEKTWTILCYLDGDNTDMNHDFSNAFDKFAEEGIGSDDRINLVIQFDRIDGDPRFGGWEIAHRFFMTPGMVPFEDVAVQDWGDGEGGREVAMSDPGTLREFIEWGADHFPADRYLLLIGDHGFGWQGLCIDDTSLGDFMLLNEFRDVLLASPVHFDMLALDLCAMHTAEVLHAIEETPVDVSVGSEVLGTVWPLWEIFRTIMEEPHISTDELACRTVDLYVDYNVGLGAEDVTLSAFRLPDFAPVTPAIRDMAEAALAEETWDQVPDLAQAAVDAHDEALICARHGSDYPNTHGMTIYFPPLEGPHGHSIPKVFQCCYRGERTGFADDARWRHLLMASYLLVESLDPRVMSTRGHMLLIDDRYVDLRGLLEGIASGK